MQKDRDHFDLSSEDLKKRTVGSGHDWLYYYRLTTVCLEHKRFVQTGSAPNWQGGRMTLCTCKQNMCSNMTVEEWEDNVWVAGIAGANANEGRDHLFYMMKVWKAYPSHYDIWREKSERILPRIAQENKRADKDKYGDIYVPIYERPYSTAEPYMPELYHEPISGHCHEINEEWKEDIERPPHHLWKRRPALLLGLPEHSYLWDGPLVPLPPFELRNNRGTYLSDFLGLLR